MSDDDRLTKLEMMVAHQDRQIQDLSDMISRQWKDIDVLKLRLERVTKQLRESSSAIYDPAQEGDLSVADIAAAEKPPHY